jgi:hypothetical protein
MRQIVRVIEAQKKENWRAVHAGRSEENIEAAKLSAT